MSAGNRGEDPDNQLRADFQFFKDNGSEFVQSRLVMKGFYDNGNLRTSTVDNYVRLVRIAEEIGIKLGITFWTQTPHNEPKGDAFYPDWVGNFRNLHSNPEIRQRWYDWVAYMVQKLNSPAIAFWGTCNEPYGINEITSIEDWIKGTAAEIRKHSNKPITCRFILGWNPMTSNWSIDGNEYFSGSYFSPSLMDELKFLSLTMYNDPASDAWNAASRATWQTLKDTIQNTRALKKHVYVVEYGKATGTYGNVDFSAAADELQRLKYQQFIDLRAVPYGLTAWAAWAWQTRSWMMQEYNICKGIITPRPAFNELVRAGTIPTPCAIDSDCPPGWVCGGNNICVPKTPTTYTLKIASSHVAPVTVDGGPLGDAPVQLEVQEGTHIIEVPKEIET